MNFRPETNQEQPQKDLPFVKEQKSFLEYTSEEKSRLIDSILLKRQNNGTFTHEEEDFIEAEREFYRGDDQPYK